MSKEQYKKLVQIFGSYDVELCIGKYDKWVKDNVNTGDVYDMLTAPIEDWQRDC